MYTQAVHAKREVDKMVSSRKEIIDDTIVNGEEADLDDLSHHRRQRALSKLVYAIRGNISSQETEKMKEMQGKKNIYNYAYQLCDTIKDMLDPVSFMSQEESRHYDKKIMAKVYSGKRLTPEEMRYIQLHYPSLYPQVLRVQIQRRAFEERVKSATSKEQVEEIYTFASMHINDKDPMAQVLQAAYDDVMKEFKQTDAYQKLPPKDKSDDAENRKNPLTQ